VYFISWEKLHLVKCIKILKVISLFAGDIHHAQKLSLLVLEMHHSIVCFNSSKVCKYFVKFPPPPQNHQIYKTGFGRSDNFRGHTFLQREKHCIYNVMLRRILVSSFAVEK
jgi:hypothetical protein